MNIKKTNQERVVIVGGGFAGIEMAQQLSNKNIQVVLIDKHNYHTFQPLLYQVATAGLEPDSIAYPLRKLFQKSPNCIFRWGEVQEIITNENKIKTNIGDLEYDYLILATGSKTNFFSFDANEMMQMKSIPEALNLRSEILQSFEKALLESDREKQREAMSFVIVGGGPTGVELAGALAEMKNHILPKDYPELDLSLMDIYLYEAAPRVLAAMSEEASKKSETYLKKLGVKVYTNNRIQSYEDGELTTQDNQKFRCETIIWTAGVKGALVNGLPDKSVTRSRIKTDEYNKVIGFENVYAIGDIAFVETEENPRGYPMVAQVAIQQGKQLAANLLRQMKGDEMRPFVYNDKGSMATIGRNRAVVDLPYYKFQGTFAWFVWMFIHILSLIGFRNKATVFVNWVYSYFTYNRALRLIIRPFRRK